MRPVAKQSKAVPLHTTQTLGGRGSIAPTHPCPRYYMGVSGQRQAPAALCPGVRTPGTHCTGGWVDLRAGLDREVRRKILCPCRGSNLDRPVVQSLVRHYTDRAPMMGPEVNHIIWILRLQVLSVESHTCVLRMTHCDLELRDLPFGVMNNKYPATGRAVPFGSCVNVQ
jgi:hypothetical protein